MAITSLTLDYSFSDEEVLAAVRASDVNNRHRLEVIQCWDMIRIWKDWVTEHFGLLSSVRHRSPPDDPPDIELIFQKRVVAMEHTKLQPPHLGQAEAIMRKSEEGGFIPSISSPPANFNEMLSVIAGVKSPWSSTIDDWKTTFDLLAITLRRKAQGMPGGGIIGIVHDLVVAATNQRVLAEIAHNIINRDEFADLADHTLILLDRSNFRQFHSCLIRRGEEIREQMQ
jgi:hypothetical protein